MTLAGVRDLVLALSRALRSVLTVVGVRQLDRLGLAHHIPPEDVDWVYAHPRLSRVGRCLSHRRMGVISPAPGSPMG